MADKKSPTSKSPKAESKEAKDDGKKPKNHEGENPKAEEYIKQAQKRLSSFFGGAAKKHGEAMDLYAKAVAQYKLASQWPEVSETYVKMAEQCEKNKNQTEGANFYIQAAKAAEHDDVLEAVKIYRMAINIYMNEDNFGSAARVWKDIGLIYESEKNYKKAVEAFDKAASCNEAEGQKSSAVQRWLDIARMASNEEDYAIAIEYFEKAAASGAETDLGKFSIQDYLYKALLCKFVIDAKKGESGEVASAIRKYCELYPNFANFRECKFVQALVKAFQDDDPKKFTDVIFQYDRVTKLDEWTTKMLVQVKRILKDGVQGSVGPSAVDILAGDSAAADSAALAGLSLEPSAALGSLSLGSASASASSASGSASPPPYSASAAGADAATDDLM